MLPISKLTKSQMIEFEKKFDSGRIVVHVRYDDECNNGHNTFAMTADIYSRARLESCGCLHEEIAKHFPKLAKYIKWHLTSSDGPLYYIENTLFHASDKDCWGKRKGEVLAYKYHVLVNGKEVADYKYVDNAIEHANKYPIGALVDKREWLYHDGKEPDLEAARRCAIWPDAELKDFTEKNLKARLLKLMEEFKGDMLELGFEY